jgi:hypothetical protein
MCFKNFGTAKIEDGKKKPNVVMGIA